MTSSSNSPQPRTDWSSRTWPMGDAASPRSTMRSYSSSVRAMPPPRPPSVKAGRTMAGSPISGSDAARLGERGGDRAARHLQPGALHRLAEEVAVLGAGDGVVVGADELDPEALERPVLVQRLGQVQRRLAAERRQQGVGALALDDLRQRPGQQRLDVGDVGELGVGHDRRRVGVDEDDLVALLLEDLARLHAGVVELGRLADDDRPRAEDEDLVQVVPTRHGRPPGSGRTGRGRRWAPARPRGGTGRWRSRPRAARGPRPCGRRG